MKHIKFSRILFAGIFLSMLMLAGRSHAAGTYKFCARWQYQFDDQNLGEDYLKYTSTYGTIPAAGTWAIVQKDSANVWVGYLDSSGCSGVLTATAGQYRIYVTAGIRTTNGAYVTVTPQESSGSTRWFYATYQLSGLSSGAITYYSNLGAGDTTAGAIAIATAMSNAQDGRFVAGQTYKVYTELGGNEGWWSSGAVWLGTDEYTGTWVSRLKTVVAHELGHGIQDRLFGFQYAPYTSNSTVELCTCNHVDYASLNSHCLQSREHIGAAQSEGFAQFHAAALFNNPAETDAWFAYYKEVRWQNGGPDQYPPVVVSAYYQPASWHWMESHSCTASNAGTEIDWMNFFYEVNTKTSNKYSFSDIAAAFIAACGGSKCTSSKTTTWTSLQNAVNARFGASSAKAQYWAQMGDWHGVNW